MPQCWGTATDLHLIHTCTSLRRAGPIRCQEADRSQHERSSREESRYRAVSLLCDMQQRIIGGESPEGVKGEMNKLGDHGAVTGQLSCSEGHS